MIRRIALFDMDGTLTEPRCKIGDDIISVLVKLQKHADIGIVTGSGPDYVFQQCEKLLDDPRIDRKKIMIYACNGTRVSKWNEKEEKYSETFCADMISEIGRGSYNSIIKRCMFYQHQITALFYKLPYYGTFFHYRGSMLNWCPIGRTADTEARAAWIESDDLNDIRECFLEMLNRDIKAEKIPVAVALGGSTSFDIYPIGWDKTYVLNHLHDYDTMTFIGDKCTGEGNDKQLFDFLQPDSSWETGSVDETVSLTEKIIDNINT